MRCSLLKFLLLFIKCTVHKVFLTTRKSEAHWRWVNLWQDKFVLNYSTWVHRQLYQVLISAILSQQNVLHDRKYGHRTLLNINSKRSTTRNASMLQIQRRKKFDNKKDVLVTRRMYPLTDLWAFWTLHFYCFLFTCSTFMQCWLSSLLFSVCTHVNLTDFCYDLNAKTNFL